MTILDFGECLRSDLSLFKKLISLFVFSPENPVLGKNQKSKIKNPERFSGELNVFNFKKNILLNTIHELKAIKNLHIVNKHKKVEKKFPKFLETFFFFLKFFFEKNRKHLVDWNIFPSFTPFLNVRYRLFKNFPINKILKGNIEEKKTREVNIIANFPCLKLYFKGLRETSKIKRYDLRKLKTFSIDPVSSLDIDDAIHFRYIKIKPQIEIGIHIPDLTVFFGKKKPNILNSNEKKKCNFFLDRKFEIFPFLISMDFFSLRQNFDRFSFSVFFIFEETSKISIVKFRRGLIRNKRCLSEIQAKKIFNQTKSILNKSRNTCFFGQKILKTHVFLQKFRSKRFKEVGKIFQKTAVLGEEPSKKNHNLYRELNEELMLLTNVTIVEKILVFFPNCVKLRKKNQEKEKILNLCVPNAIILASRIDFRTIKKYLKSLGVFEQNKLFYYNGFLVFKKNYKNTYKEKKTFLFFSEKNLKNICQNQLNIVYSKFTSPIRRLGDSSNQEILKKII